MRAEAGIIDAMPENLNLNQDHDRSRSRSGPGAVARSGQVSPRSRRPGTRLTAVVS